MMIVHFELINFCIRIALCIVVIPQKKKDKTRLNNLEFI
jgi:hypothetical protein